MNYFAYERMKPVIERTRGAIEREWNVMIDCRLL